MTDNPEDPTLQTKRRSLLNGLRHIDLSAIAFVASLCAFSFGYGVIAYKYRLFPYAYLEAANSAFSAWQQLESETLMNGAEPGANLEPVPLVRTLNDRAGAENILISGGPFQFMERCPRFGCLAWIINRNGEILHSWEVDLEDVVRRLQGSFSGSLTTGNVYPVGLALDKAGNLYVTFHARNAYPYQVGIAKIGPDGTILWFNVDHSHHWPIVAPDGKLYSPSMRIRENIAVFDGSIIDTRCNGKMYDEGVRVYSSEGKVTSEYWIGDLLAASSYRGPLYSTRDSCDPFHVNSVDIATADVAANSRDIREGDLLVSVRELGAVLVVDQQSRRLRDVMQGPFSAQHSAKFLPNGTFLLFDNQGGDPALGGSRVLNIDIVTKQVRTLFPHASDGLFLPFVASQRGAINVSADGQRAMVASGENGLIIELDVQTGAPLWYVRNSHSISAFLDSHNIKSNFENALFVTYGGYYVSDLPFLSKERDAR